MDLRCRRSSDAGWYTAIQIRCGWAIRESDGSVVVVYDGDGQRVKQFSAYELRSSVLGGQVLTQIGPDGNKQIITLTRRQAYWARRFLGGREPDQ